MREILFRGKRIEDGQWVEGHYHFANWYLPPSMEIVDRTHHILQIGRGDADKIDPDTLGQFTGLTDKNGKKIFEGDICKHRSNYSGEYVISVVTYTDGQFLAMADNNSGFNLSDKLEVIGNIHDNPELLEGE